jgi:high-affinity iron transporter
MSSSCSFFSRSLFLVWLTAACSLLASVAHASEADVRRVWQMLDYLSVDYGGAVANGKVKSESEFSEMREFAETARSKIAGMERKPEQTALVREAEELQRAIEAKSDADQVAALGKALGNHLLAAYPVPLAPATVPDVKAAVAVYQANCASCHGVTGKGDGPAGARLEPKPVAFTDADRARHRSVFALYQAISQGISGTAMPAFAQLSEQDRWALATYLGQFSHSGPQKAKGQDVWQKDEPLRKEVGGLESFVRLTEAELAKKVGEEHAGAAMAFLHAEPSALSATSSQKLTVARERLDESVAAYASKEPKKAADAALASYLDGVEPFEQTLAARDKELMIRIETAMSRYRSLLVAAAPVGDVQKEAESIRALFGQAEAALATSAGDATAAFFGSLTILLREGLEALLVVVGMIAFLRKAERKDVLPYVHAGWVGALAAGGLTWFAATYLVTITGANREVTEGLSSLFAAIVLLSVGIWMHQKSVAGQWQSYLHQRLSSALNRKSALFLFGLSFIAVYREVFETVLFYAAMWGQGNDGAILAGLGAGAVSLAVIAVLLLAFSARLPIGKFFSFSSVLVAVLAVVLTGKGVAALQEAGWIQPHAVSAPRIELLGVYPSTIGLLAQFAVLAVALFFFMRNRSAAPN